MTLSGPILPDHGPREDGRVVSGAPWIDDAPECCGNGWDISYRCETCGHGGPSQGLDIWPRPDASRALRLQMGNDTAHPEDRLFCWAHWPGRTIPEPRQLELVL